MDDVFFDTDGNPVSLDRLCVLEPAWAASRIRVAMEQIKALKAAMAKSAELRAQLEQLERVVAGLVRR